MNKLLDGSYRTLLKSDASVKALLKKVPWVLNGTVQSKEALVECLMNESERLAHADLTLKFSLITPLWNTSPRYITDLIASCRMQTYANWELILVDDGSQKKDHFPVIRQMAAIDSRIRFFESEKNGGISAARNIAIDKCTGDFVCVLDHDDLLHPQILGIYARLLAEHKDCNLIYCNEVKISDDLSLLSEFCSKPDFCLATLLRTNYICHFTAVKRSSLEQIKTSAGEYFQSRFDSVEDHDLFIRLAQLKDFSPRHVPVFGYYWRRAPTSTALTTAVKSSVWETGKHMLSEHLGQRAEIVTHPHRGGNELHSIYFQPTAASEEIDVIIPFKDKTEMTISCIEALEKQSMAGKLNVFLVDNDSQSESTLRTLRGWMGASRKNKYSLISCPGPFNYSRINNWAVKNHCQRKYVLFLNNDVILQSENALAAMAGELDHHEEAAVVGMRLLYPDGSLQHGGMRLTRNSAKLFQPTHISGDREFTKDEHVVFSVTFACAMVRRAVFVEAGGFDEIYFANGLSDVDVCCKVIRWNKKVFYMGTLLGIHHESKTRKTQAEDFEVQMLNERYGEILGRYYLKQYGYNLITPSSQEAETFYEIPLRYRIADQLNHVLKASLGPAHKALKRSFQRT